MRALGLDIGTKTIGLAVADELGFTAQGLDTIRRTSTKNDIAAVKRVVDEYLVTVLVLGLPLNMDGTEGSRAEACRKFGTYLHDTLKIEVEYQDE